MKNKEEQNLAVLQHEEDPLCYGEQLHNENFPQHRVTFYDILTTPAPISPFIASSQVIELSKVQINRGMGPHNINPRGLKVCTGQLFPSCGMPKK